MTATKWFLKLCGIVLAAWAAIYGVFFPLIAGYWTWLETLKLSAAYSFGFAVLAPLFLVCLVFCIIVDLMGRRV